MCNEEKEERIVLVVDGPNIDYLIGYLFSEKPNARIDFSKLLKLLVNKRRLDKAVYVGRTPRKGVKEKFYLTLESLGYSVYCPEKDLMPGDDWDDNYIRTNLEEWANDSDTVIIVSGDGGFYEICKILINKNKKIEFASLKKMISTKLLEIGTFIDLETKGAEIEFPIELRPKENNDDTKKELLVGLEYTITCKFPEDLTEDILNDLSELENKLIMQRRTHEMSKKIDIKVF